MTENHYRNKFDIAAFTLVELLVVVAIIAVLSSVAIPAFMSVRNKAAASIAKKERNHNREDATPPGIHFTESSPPIIESYRMDWSLHSDYQRVGLDVYSRYQLDGSGEIVFRTPGAANRVNLHLPFPEGTIEATDVLLEFSGGNNTYHEPDEVVYHQTGIYWSGELSADESVAARISYRAMGTERLSIALPKSRRISNVELSLDLSKTPAESIDSFSLRPTDTGNNIWQWQYRNLVSERNITVFLPGAKSPSGKIILLLRFLALAVLLFGAGFLYMSECYAPGALDKFRWGHFLLLALTYSLFFVVFSVIIYREHLAVVPAILVALASSFPLLAIHVARIIDLRFSLRYILPLAALSIALVVNGIYGGDFRDYIFLLMLILSSAYLTITYRPKSEKPGRDTVPLGV